MGLVLANDQSDLLRLNAGVRPSRGLPPKQKLAKFQMVAVPSTWAWRDNNGQ